MPLYEDQLKRSVAISNFPKRIISVVPSQTELLYDLGLDHEVIGITKFCVHPGTWFKNKTRVGGTKQLNLDKIRSLQPDLIIANREENVQEQINELANDFPVWVSDINDLNDALSMITSIGIITGKEEKAENIRNRIEENFGILKAAIHDKKQAVYLIWKDPLMTTGGDNFINEMMKYAGFSNLFQNQTRYPVITPDDIINKAGEANCLVLLSSEPFPFSTKHIHELQQQMPGYTFILVDGEMFSWYGSRLEKAPAYFLELQKQIQSLYLF
jgi:ABC-type Fe3+-hydroxamate transport system substrate-binding protein